MLHEHPLTPITHAHLCCDLRLKGRGVTERGLTAPNVLRGFEDFQRIFRDFYKTRFSSCLSRWSFTCQNLAVNARNRAETKIKHDILEAPVFLMPDSRSYRPTRPGRPPKPNRNPSHPDLIWTPFLMTKFSNWAMLHLSTCKAAGQELSGRYG